MPTNCRDIQLWPGDLLFVPRRSVHSARTSSAGPSTHLTLGIEPKWLPICGGIGDALEAAGYSGERVAELVASALPPAATEHVDIDIISRLDAAATVEGLRVNLNRDAVGSWLGYAGECAEDDADWTTVRDVLASTHDVTLVLLSVKLNS